MTLGQAYREAMQIMDAQRKQGTTLAERVKGLEAVLRQFWPFRREWKYLCSSCDDLGLVIADCGGDATCGRSKEHLPHTFGTPCWCEKGRVFRDKPKATAEDFTAAGKTMVAKPMTRLGR